ncbi:MAG: formate/nitrite transporter family protein [Rubrivivax sp.]
MTPPAQPPGPGCEPGPDAGAQRGDALAPTTARFGFDAFSPREVAERIEVLGVAKARLPLSSMALLAVLAGAYIGFGSLFFLLVISDPSLPFAAARVLGGLVFSLGLLTVVVAGAELFTGNHLLAMAWADGRLRTGEVLRNWAVVCLGNALGAGLLAWAVAGADLGALNGGRLAQQAMKVAQAKADLPADVAFLRGVLCNVLVCLAVWMAAAGRSVVDKAVAVVPPVTAFVALGFEHSVANFFFFPLALLLEHTAAAAGLPAPSVGAILGNLLPVIAGNLLGGSVLVAGVYWVVYRRGVR